jgi:Alpha-glutamyl/putrescinyl thymine pyrophosphorylase clade 2
MANPLPDIGRYCDLNGVEERTDIGLATDLRRPEFRRETFLIFFETHLLHRSHPGCVYFLLPALADRLGLDPDQRMYLAYLTGNTQNVVMSWLILSRYPTPRHFIESDGAAWFNREWDRFQFDTDRRHQKRDLCSNLAWYVREVGHHPCEYFTALAGEGFQDTWRHIRENFPTFGRLSAFSFSEYLRVLGIGVECDDLFLADIQGSMSHRNGLAKVLGRDDLDFVNKDPTYSVAQLDWLKEEAELLLAESQKRFRDRDFFSDVGYFTLESALCTYKSWSRPNRRYPNVYADMFHDRIRWAEAKWPEVNFDMFWDIRREALPQPLRLEDNPRDVGVKPLKQNFYRVNGRAPMLGYDHPLLWSDYDTLVQEMTGEEWHARTQAGVL